MKKIENNFTVSGFVGKDAEIRQFANASVARFSLAVGRQEKNGEYPSPPSPDGAGITSLSNICSALRAAISP